MEKENVLPYKPATIEFLTQFLAAAEESQQTSKSANAEKTSSSALIYEKIRTSLEYQEEHLILKNAITRITRRLYTLAPNISAKKLYAELFSELAWAGYVDPETIPKDKVGKAEAAVERYVLLLKHSKFALKNKFETQKIIITWLACELDEILKPQIDRELLVSYTASILEKTVSIKDVSISPEDNLFQIKLAAFALLYKPDPPLLQFWVLKKLNPEWQSLNDEEVKHFASHFEARFTTIEQTLNHPLRSRYLRYVKRNIAPFMLIKDLPSTNTTLERISSNPTALANFLLAAYDSRLREVKEKIWRGTFRALIFILLTKISLAFILEAPFDHLVAGQVNYISLLINVSLPPLLMLVAGSFIKSPPAKNRQLVANSINLIIDEEKISNKDWPLKARTYSSLERSFNLIYSLLSLGVIVGVVYLLVRLDFNFLSIILFFFFVSAVSFFSFRIRSLANELAMASWREDNVTFFIEALFLPFVRIGKIISERIYQANPFVLAIDFLIEAPLKSLLKIINSWLKFLRSKKEEIEF